MKKKDAAKKKPKAKVAPTEIPRAGSTGEALANLEVYENFSYQEHRIIDRGILRLLRKAIKPNFPPDLLSRRIIALLTHQNYLREH